MLKGKSLSDKMKDATDECTRKYTEKRVLIYLFGILILCFFIFIVSRACVDPT